MFGGVKGNGGADDRKVVNVGDKTPQPALRK